MGWSWPSRHTTGTRSYGAHAELGDHLRKIAPRQDWQAISVLFNRGAGDPFELPPHQAADIARAFTALAPLASPTWARACYDLAASAGEAARNNSTWSWT
jgi:hypothetical protein